jgi:hypothetical protein
MSLSQDQARRWRSLNPNPSGTLRCIHPHPSIHINIPVCTPFRPFFLLSPFPFFLLSYFCLPILEFFLLLALAACSEHSSLFPETIDQYHKPTPTASYMATLDR